MATQKANAGGKVKAGLLDFLVALFREKNVAPGYAPVDFEAKLTAVGGTIIDFTSFKQMSNSDWVLKNSEDQLIARVKYDVKYFGCCRIDKQGKNYYMKDANGMTHLCTIL